MIAPSAPIGTRALVDARPAETVWGAGRFDAGRGPRRILFGRMYEDARIEQAAFPPGGRVFCIASAGCTALALCDRHPVVACDINPVQLAYAARRIAGAPAEVGSAERLIGFARSLMGLVGWRKEVVREFVRLADPTAQLTFWKERLDTRRFRAGLALLTSIGALRTVYARELTSCLPRRFGTVLRHRMERAFAIHPNADNPHIAALLLGDELASNSDLRRLDPHPVESPSAPSACGRTSIELVEADAATYLERCAPRSFAGFTLSNILDGATAKYRERLRQALRHAALPDAQVVLRSFGEPPGDLEGNRAAEDRSMLWGIVQVRRASEL